MIFQAIRVIAVFVILISSANTLAFEDPDYLTLIRNPKSARANAELRAFLLGVATVIRVDYDCDEVDRITLSDPDKSIDELISYASTSKGLLALEDKLGIGEMRYKSKSGEVLLEIFTESVRCKTFTRPKQQLYP